MPQAKRSTSTRASTKFKQPAALKRLTTSLDTAQKALAELSKGGGRATGKAGKDIYADLRKFVSDARRDSGKLGKALQREFDQAQKELAKATKSASTTRARSSSSGKRSTSSRSTSSRSTSSRSSSGRSTTRRASGTARRASGTARRATGGTTRRSGGSSRGGSSKS